MCLQRFLDNDFMCAKSVHRLFIRSTCRERLQQDALAVELDRLDDQQKLHIVRMIYNKPAAGLVVVPLSMNNFANFLAAHGVFCTCTCQKQSSMWCQCQCQDMQAYVAVLHQLKFTH
jgi:hypothetical protein